MGEANPYGGHVYAISTAVPLRMEGSVEPEHSRSSPSDFSDGLTSPKRHAATTELRGNARCAA